MRVSARAAVGSLVVRAAFTRARGARALCVLVAVRVLVVVAVVVFGAAYVALRLCPALFMREQENEEA